ncbi:hypothetical protein ACSTIO_23840, partial [Vibrio parahaemolyticus]
FKKIDTVITYKYCFLISGPEPQRTIFEEKVFELASHIEEEVVVVRGILNRPETGDRLPSTIHNHLPTNELAMVLQK